MPTIWERRLPQPSYLPSTRGRHGGRSPSPSAARRGRDRDRSWIRTRSRSRSRARRHAAAVKTQPHEHHQASDRVEQLVRSVLDYVLSRFIQATAHGDHSQRSDSDREKKKLKKEKAASPHRPQHELRDASAIILRQIIQHAILHFLNKRRHKVAASVSSRRHPERSRSRDRDRGRGMPSRKREHEKRVTWNDYLEATRGHRFEEQHRSRPIVARRASPPRKPSKPSGPLPLLVRPPHRHNHHHHVRASSPLGRRYPFPTSSRLQHSRRPPLLLTNSRDIIRASAALEVRLDDTMACLVQTEALVNHVLRQPAAAVVAATSSAASGPRFRYTPLREAVLDNATELQDSILRATHSARQLKASLPRPES